MKPITEFTASNIKYIFTDIDDTLTDHGQLKPKPYEMLWELKNKGFEIVPITGRPAGWCEMIARFWPVEAIIGENGGFYFYYENNKMNRHFYQDESTRKKNRHDLDALEKQILNEVPGCAVSSDQFCRILDLAIDFCEDVKPLHPQQVQRIIELFKAGGAQAKESSIHVNGWFGDFDKLKMCKIYCKEVLKIDPETNQDQICFIGDSPNDEPMFEFFNNSVAVSNIKKFKNQLKHKPNYITPSSGGSGFCEFAEALLNTN